MRLGRRSATVSLLAITLVACGGGTTRSATPNTTDASATTDAPTTSKPATTGLPTVEPLQLLILGDSVAIPSMGCGSCVGFDEQYRAHLETSTGRPVVLTNEARPEFRLVDLQELLDSDTTVQQLVADADVVVVSIGYNGGPPWDADRPCHPAQERTDVDLLIALRDFTEACMNESNESFRDEFDAVYSSIEQLAAGKPQLRIDLGNFNNLLDNPGGDGTLDAVWAGEDVPGLPHADLQQVLANMVTAIAGYNAVECETASAHGFVCAGLLEAFNGPDGTGSLAGYVNPADYVHPNENGQRVIAELLAAVGLGPLGNPGTESAGPIAGLPPAPLVLYEWYPAGEDTKSIIVSDAELTAPPVRVVPESDGAAIHAAWSHDGSRFTWEVLRNDDTASVWTANADGSDPVERVVCSAAPCVEMSYPAFSPDDEQLLVTRFDAAGDGDWGPSHLVVVDLATGEQTIIASTADGATAFYSATWSPDGSQVAAALETYTDATENTRTGNTIVVVDTDPTTPDAPIPVTDPALFAGYPRWHPTDDRILFASWDLDAFQGAEESQLYTVGADGSGLTQITNVDDPTTTRRPGEASWTSDGQRIIASIGVVSSGHVVDVKIAWIDPATGAITETEASGAMPTLQP
jgi:Tol biopolymer transport system component/lysophospholipase L1-like esterase